MLGPMSPRFFVANYLNEATQGKLKGVPQVTVKLSVCLWSLNNPNSNLKVSFSWNMSVEGMYAFIAPF